MLRDKNKTTAYFNDYMEEELDDIRFYRESLDSGRTKLEQIDAVKKQLFQKRHSIIVAMYSKGDAIGLIREKYIELLDGEISISHLHNRYVDFLWLLSLGILLEVDDSLLTKLSDLTKRDDLNDCLVNFLITARNPGWNVQGNSFLHNIPYRLFNQILDVDKTTAAENLKIYLEKAWYKGHDDCGWYGSHKREGNIYFGYWSFESAAVAKLLNLDDAGFKDNAYYPYDLVHWTK